MNTLIWNTAGFVGLVDRQKYMAHTQNLYIKLLCVGCVTNVSASHDNAEIVIRCFNITALLKTSEKVKQVGWCEQEYIHTGLLS